MSDLRDLPAELVIGDVIGKGAYGSVYCAEYGGRVAAVKSVPIEDGDDGAALCGEIQNEIRMLRECDTQFIVRYFGCITKGRTLWIAMELCDGGSIADLLRRSRSSLREEEIAVVSAGVVRGLHYLHTERHVLHRDIKAGNVLLTSRDGGGIKLCDLGVSASVASHAKRSTVIGTPLWMSPELIESGSYGASTDIWSFGITCLEMAEVHPPHAHVNPTIRALFLITAKPAPKLREPTRWSDDFVSMLDRCLIKEPETRADTAELLQHPFVVRGTSLGSAPIFSMIERSRGLREPSVEVSSNANATVDMMTRSFAEYDETTSMQRTVQLDDSTTLLPEVRRRPSSDETLLRRDEALPVRRMSDTIVLDDGTIELRPTLSSPLEPLTSNAHPTPPTDPSTRSAAGGAALPRTPAIAAGVRDTPPPTRRAGTGGDTPPQATRAASGSAGLAATSSASGCPGRPTHTGGDDAPAHQDTLPAAPAAWRREAWPEDHGSAAASVAVPGGQGQQPQRQRGRQEPTIVSARDQPAVTTAGSTPPVLQQAVEGGAAALADEPNPAFGRERHNAAAHTPPGTQSSALQRARASNPHRQQHPRAAKLTNASAEGGAGGSPTPRPLRTNDRGISHCSEVGVSVSPADAASGSSDDVTLPAALSREETAALLARQADIPDGGSTPAKAATPLANDRRSPHDAARELHSTKVPPTARRCSSPVPESSAALRRSSPESLRGAPAPPAASALGRGAAMVGAATMGNLSSGRKNDLGDEASRGRDRGRAIPSSSTMDHLSTGGDARDEAEFEISKEEIIALLSAADHEVSAAEEAWTIVVGTSAPEGSGVETHRSRANVAPPRHEAMEKLCIAAKTYRYAPVLLDAGAMPLFLRGLTSPDSSMQGISLYALLSLSLHAPESQQAMLADSYAETLLGMAFTNTPDVRRQALQLLATLASSRHCAHHLCEPTLFSSLVTICRIQAEQRDFDGTQRALQIIDALLLFEGDGLGPSQRQQAALLADSLLAAYDNEALRASAQRTRELAHSAREDLLADLSDMARRSINMLGESIGSLFLTPQPRKRRSQLGLSESSSSLGAGGFF